MSAFFVIVTPMNCSIHHAPKYDLEVWDSGERCKLRWAASNARHAGYCDRWSRRLSAWLSRVALCKTDRRHAWGGDSWGHCIRWGPQPFPMTRERRFDVGFAKLLWPHLATLYRQQSSCVLWQLFCIYFVAVGRLVHCHESSVCNTAFVLRKEISRR